jgi:HEAT repeat protein
MTHDNTIRAARIFLAAALFTAVSSLQILAAGTNAAEKEQTLIGILKSDAPKADKAITCRELAVYGTKAAVPFIAPFLSDPELASWARIALEVIPGGAADEALRTAAVELKGDLLAGVINSIGVRRDAQAVGALASMLAAQDANVVSAAAEALGRIGNTAALRALEQQLGSASGGTRQSVAYGCIIGAEKLMTDAQLAAAASLYDKVRNAEVSKQRKLEATRGAILARQSDGIPLLLEQLRSPDAGFLAVGLRAARELPGLKVTQALANEIDKTEPERQMLVFMAFADRTDQAVLPKVLQLAQNGPRAVRISAITQLDRYRDLACIPVLLEAAVENDPQLSRAARSALARLGGNDIEADLIARLRLASGKTRTVLLDLAKQRRIKGALPIVMRSAQDNDAAVRRAAVEAAGVLGTDQELPALAGLLSSTHSRDELEDLEAALLAICSRNGARCLPHVLPLASAAAKPNLRKTGLRALGSIGGPDALDVVKQALNSQDEGARDEAVSVLSTWPNTWPNDQGVAEPLLALIKSAAKPSYRALGLQGYLHYISENQKLPESDKLSRLEEVFGISKTPDEKRQVIGVLGGVTTGAALERLLALAADESVTEEACLAAIRIATAKNLKDWSKEQRREALEKVVEKSRTDATRERATAAMQKLR